jgi:hypothetical protein
LAWFEVKNGLGALDAGAASYQINSKWEAGSSSQRCRVGVDA